MIEAKTSQIFAYLDSLLRIKEFSRFQFGRRMNSRKTVRKAAFAVSLTKKVIADAIKKNADFIFTHHDAWQKYEHAVAAEKKALLKKHKIAHYFAHAPLDCLKDYGTTYSLAKAMNLDSKKITRWCVFDKHYCALLIELRKAVKFNFFLKKAQVISRSQGLKYFKSRENIRMVAVVPGAGNKISYLQLAKEKGADTFLTGEHNLASLAFSEDINLNYLALGHTCSEKPGVASIKKLVAKTFKIKTIWIDESCY